VSGFKKKVRDLYPVSARQVQNWVHTDHHLKPLALFLFDGFVSGNLQRRIIRAR